jgi:nucleotide-binding universal stress UspA family protein
LIRLFRRFQVRDAGAQFEALNAAAPRPDALEIRQIVASDIARAICDEAALCGADVILLGSGDQATIGGALIEEVVGRAPCHVAIMRARERVDSYRRIFVPVDGSVASRLAVELAHRYAENAGAELTLAVLTERRPQASTIS